MQFQSANEHRRCETVAGIMAKLSEINRNCEDNLLPDLHKQAFYLKNRKRMQHDGGRAWIKDGQLHEAVTDANYRIERGQPLVERLRGTGRDILERRLGMLLQSSNTIKRL